MGVDISGGMIVGTNAEKVESQILIEDEDGNEVYPTDEGNYEDFYEWYEYHYMSTYSLWYDSGTDGQVVGFKVPDINPLSDEFESWVANVKKLAKEFKDITGVEPELIGMQNVW